MGLVVSYIPGVNEFYQRVMDGQIFELNASQTDDALKIHVTAKHPGTSDVSGYENNISSLAPVRLPDEIVKTPEVFLVQDGIYSYEEAEPLCRAYGSRLATMGDLYDAWKKGADWCEYGWVKGHKAVFPTQKSSWVLLQKSDKKSTRQKCGLPGLNGGTIRDKSRRFGVHCYGVKPPTWRNYMANSMVSKNLTAQEHKEDEMTSEFKRKLNQYTIVPFSKVRWSDVYKTSADQ